VSYCVTAVLATPSLWLGLFLARFRVRFSGVGFWEDEGQRRGSGDDREKRGSWEIN